jgi:hypothetical protein
LNDLSIEEEVEEDKLVEVEQVEKILPGGKMGHKKKCMC